MSEFQKKLAVLINEHSIETETDTPDFALAQYLNDCLDAFGTVMKTRDKWNTVKNGQEINDLK
jgi:hypothetical protein